MSYASLAHVQALNPQRSYGASTFPASPQVQMFLDQTAALIDGILTEAGYQLPVPTVATGALKFLEGLNAKAAWVEVERAAPTSQHKAAAEAMWEASLKMLTDHHIVLDSPRTDTRDAPRGAGLTQLSVGITPSPMLDPLSLGLSPFGPPWGS